MEVGNINTPRLSLNVYIKTAVAGTMYWRFAEIVFGFNGAWKNNFKLRLIFKGVIFILLLKIASDFLKLNTVGIILL